MSTSPWKTIWLKPKQAFKDLQELGPSYMRTFFALVIGLSSATYMMGHVTTNLSDWARLFAIVLAVVCYPFLTYAFFQICGWVLWKVSGWMKGSASLDQARTVFIWSNAPGLVNFLFILLSLIVSKSIGMNVIFGDISVVDAMSQLPWLRIIIVLAAFVTFLWSIYIYINGISLINNFSFGKTFMTWLISAFLNTLIIGTIMTLFSFVIVSLFGALIG